MKFELTAETKVYLGRTLYRIKALVAFGLVSAGNLGGWVEKSENIDQSGDAWVYGNAQVSGNARVSGDARVYGDAWVSGDARVYGDAQVSGDAWVSGNAWVYGNARVSGDARVYGDARSIQADLWMVLTQNRNEVPALLDAIRAGRVDGSTYEGDCACLVGTIANARNISFADIEHDAGRPCEQWFAGISRGDTPADNYHSKMAEQWVCEWMTANGVPVVDVAAQEA